MKIRYISESVSCSAIKNFLQGRVKHKIITLLHQKDPALVWL